MNDEKYFPISCEVFNPKGFLCKLSVGEQKVFEYMSMLVWKERDLLVRTSISHIEKRFGGRLKSRTISSHLKTLKSKGFVRLIKRDHHLGNIYFVEPLIIGGIGNRKQLKNFGQSKMCDQRTLLDRSL